MKFSRTAMASAGLVLALAFGSASWAAEKSPAESLAKAPPAVQAAAKKALGSKKLEEFDKESVGGKIEYEVGFKVGGVDHAYIISETGELIQEEADVEVSKLPSAVLEAVKKAEPTGKIDEAATATAGDKKFYEVDVKVGKETHAIQVSADGTVLANEIEKTLGNEGDSKEADKKD
jgi:streptogramin lyase